MRWKSGAPENETVDEKGSSPSDYGQVVLISQGVITFGSLQLPDSRLAFHFSAYDRVEESDEEKPSEKDSFHPFTQDDCALVRCCSHTRSRQLCCPQ